jgi:hypothetical protein
MPTGICTATTKAGKPCRCLARYGKSTCWFHDPQEAEAVAAARQRGNLKSHAPKPPEAGSWHLETAEDVRKVLEHTIGSLLRNQMDRSRANAICFAAQVSLRTLDIAGLEARIAALEEARQPKTRGK